LLNVVGNVEKNDLKETALYVVKSLNTKNQQTKKLVQPDVLINCEENILQVHCLNKLLLNVNTAEKTSPFRHLKKTEDFVHLVAGINIILEKIINGGEVGLHQKNNISIVQENGGIVVNLFGKEIMQLVRDVEKDLIIHKKPLKSIISDLFIQKNKQQIIETLFSYVVSAIVGYIPKKILSQNILTFQIKIKHGYTAKGITEKGEVDISKTARKKALGNGFNCAVIKHILENIL